MTFHDVQIAQNGHVRNPETTGELGVVEHRSEIGAKHGPESPKRGGGNGNARLKDIPFQERGHILFGARVGSSRPLRPYRPVGDLPAATGPASAPLSHIAQPKSMQLVIGHTAGPGIRTIAVSGRGMHCPEPGIAGRGAYPPGSAGERAKL
jgi:hypothetical protein